MYDVNYIDIFALVVKMTTIRTLFTIATIEKWKIHQMDIKTAFLLSDLNIEIYMELPEGF